MSDLVRELIGDIKHGLEDEWGRRTTYGKLLFPFWVGKTAVWMSGLAACFLLVGAWKREMESIEEPVFEVYEDDE